MTQQAVVVPSPVAVAAPASAGGEPTIEELAELIPKPEAPALEEIATEPAEAAPAETDAPVEEPKVEPAEADAALERATKAAARAREGSRRYAETQRQLAEQSHHAQQAAREAEQLRRENAAAKQREEALLKDPYKALKDRGMTDVQLAERAMRENSPEAVVQQLKEQVEQERAARLQLEQRLEHDRVTAIRNERARVAQASFAAEADNEEAYPLLSQLNGDVQLTLAREALNRIKARGYDETRLTDAQVAEAAETLLKSKRAAKAAAAAAPAVVAKPAVAKTSGKTLTNAMSQTRMVAPATFDDLSEEQQFAHLAASLPDPG